MAMIVTQGLAATRMALGYDEDTLDMVQRRWWSAAVAAAIVVGGATLATLLLVRGAPPSRSASPGSAAVPAWSTLVTPKLGGRTDLRSVACVSSSSCVAVGSSGSAGLPTALVESWDGRAWSVARSESRGVDSWLNAAACPTAGWCVAVGGDSPTGDSDNPLDQTLVEVLSGTRWSVIPSPTPGTGDQSDLQSVACVSPTFCMAVGSFSRVSNPYDPEVKPLIEMWDGSSWTALADGGAELGRQSVLQSVVCMATISCIAVGSSSSIAATGDSVGHALVERWDGTSWRMVPTPSGGLGTKSSLESVSCPAANSCVAAGSFTSSDGRTSMDRTLVERWEGGTWSIVASPNQGTEPSALRSISCTSPVACLAVGSFSTGSALEKHQGLAETWNCLRWSIAAAPGSNAELASVACVASGSCTAVGKAASPSAMASEWQAFVARLVVRA